MKIAFYYHLDVAFHNGDIYIPSLLGVFINDLSSRVEEFILLAHTMKYDQKVHDFKLNSERIRLFDLGRKNNFAERLLFGCPKLNNVSKVIDCDLLLVRAPTPLAPSLFKYFHHKCPITFLLVGDYSTIPFSRYSSRHILLSFYEYRMNHHILPKVNVLVNSRALYEKYKKITKDIYEVRTTTITEKDFYYREDTCQTNVIRLLYVGRYDWQKGFAELFEAVAKLKQTINIKLHMVGWDDSANQNIRKEMEERIDAMGISDCVILEGKKSLGSELNSMYRMSDIFVLPSYSEGMPRCIWEAMANGIPVVSTMVGGIPYNIENRREALLVEPHSSEVIVSAIQQLVIDEDLRKCLIRNGYFKAKQATLNACNSKIVEILNRIVK